MSTLLGNICCTFLAMVWGCVLHGCTVCKEWCDDGADVLSNISVSPPTPAPTIRLSTACSAAHTPYEIASIVCPQQTLESKGNVRDLVLYQKVKDKVIFMYNRLQDRCDDNSCEKGDFAGAVLRFAGHDFMDWNAPGLKGGSDGCIDFDDPDNAGLKPTLCGEGEFGHGATLNQAYKEFCEEVSYADFTVIAAEAMMIRTRPDYSEQTQTSPSLSFDFKFGRRTAKKCEKTVDTTLPDPIHGCEAVDEVFNKRMELNDWRASTALMGVHTLGRMRAVNSGFEGWWNTGEGSRHFTNDFYKTMTTGWHPKKNIGGNPKKHAWIRADDGPTTDLFLDTDLCLFQGKDITAADAPDTCHWSIISDGWGNGNFCITSTGERDESLFPLGCCKQHFPDILDPVALAAMCKGTDPCFLNEEFFSEFGEGAATQDVIEFARDETAWLSEFKKAWKKATENSLRS